MAKERSRVSPTDPKECKFDLMAIPLRLDGQSNILRLDPLYMQSPTTKTPLISGQKLFDYSYL
ncbi:MAG TPA: hypothetical protein VFI70_08800 [Nitrososphaeraceae archaeon]|nr:hypothetical protein [Nitrososphaeraceae archaeon]